MSLKICPFCNQMIPSACKTCPKCGAVILKKREKIKVYFIRNYQIEGLFGGPLPDYQELLVPCYDSDRFPTKDVKALGTTCVWCNRPIKEDESRAEETGTFGKLKLYHLGCHDAKDAGCKPPTRLI